MKKVLCVSEFENVTGMFNLYQLLINLCDWKFIQLEISSEKLT